MKAYILHEKTLRLSEIETPTPQAHQVLIKAKAISLNPVDYKVTQGTFKLETPRVIGIDVAGEVTHVGSGVEGIQPGNRVCAMVNIFETGSFAELVCVDSAAVSKIPDTLDFAHAATIPCAGITAWQAIMEKINLRKGQTVFITAGGGGVGGFAIQFAKRMGATVITTASQDFERIQKLGADYIINYKESDIAQAVKDITQGQGADYMVNCISADDIVKHANILRFNGCIVGITGIPEKYPYAPFSKAAGLIEVALVAAYTGGDTNSLREVAVAGSQIATLMAEGKITANISQVFDFENLPLGLKLFAEGKSSGKIIVKV